MLDTYDSLEWEKNDNEDEDAEVIGACDSDKDEEEAGAASADDTADVSDSEVVLLTEEEKIEMRMQEPREMRVHSEGLADSSKSRGYRSRSNRGHEEGAVVRRIGKQRKYETRYPG